METIVAFGCVHGPVQDRRSVDWALGVMEAVKPTGIVNLGDVIEGDALSVHPSYYDHDLADEVGWARKFFKEVESATPGAWRVLTKGNHDDRLGDKVRCEKMRRLLRFENLLGDALEGWKVLPYVNDPGEGVFKVGQVRFTHGFAAGHNSDKSEAVTLGAPYGLLVRAHTHRPVPVTQVMMTTSVPLPYWFMNVGTLGPRKPSWSHRLSTPWGPGVAIIQVRPGRSFARRPTWRATLVQPDWGVPSGRADVGLALDFLEKS